jgi:NIMA (never in mitosis gene a)-related kinase
MENFEIVKQLGSGSYSTVYRVRRLTDNVDYAMKKVKLSALNRHEKANALNEIRILASVNHKNVIGYKEAFYDEESGQLCIVMEIADSGDLESKIEQAKKMKSFIKENKIWYIFK